MGPVAEGLAQSKVGIQNLLPAQKKVQASEGEIPTSGRFLPGNSGPRCPIWTGAAPRFLTGITRLNTSKFVGHPLGRKIGSIPQFLCRPRLGSENGLNTANATHPENRLNTAVRVGHWVSGSSITSASRGAIEYIHPTFPGAPGKGRMSSTRRYRRISAR